MRNPIIALTLLVLAATAASCSNEKYAYVGDAPRNETMAISNQISPTLKPNDQLYIYVYSLNPTSVRPFNQETNMAVAENEVRVKTRVVNGYTISPDGYIIFPAVGRVHAAGLTLNELERAIEGRLVEGRFVKDPIVSASIMNFQVTVIGEVAHPQMLEGDGIRMTIFEAIARCGDVTMSGIRSKVTVIRADENQEYTVDTVDLTNRNILESKYYYLQSGDIIYVEPTPKRKRQAYRNEDWPKYLTTGISAVRIAWNIYYRYAVRRVQDKYDVNK